MKLRIHFNVNTTIKLLLLFLFVVNASESLYAPLFAVFITKSIAGATLATVGFAAAIYALTKSVVQVPLARAIDAKKGERDDFKVMIAGAVLGIIYAFSLIMVTRPWQLFLLQIVSGVGGACLMAAYYGIFARHIDHGSEGFEWSLFSVGGLTISAALGGAIGGVFADLFGFITIFTVAGFSYLAAVILLIALYPHLDVKKKSRRYDKLRDTI